MTDYNTNIENQGFDGVCAGLQFMEIRSNFVSHHMHKHTEWTQIRYNM